MATARTRHVQTLVSPTKKVKREEDANYIGGHSDDAMEEDRDPLEDSGCTKSDESEEEDEEEEEAVTQGMCELESSFTGFNQRFHLLNKIGEGTFSTVYKAVDLQYGLFRNDWDYEAKEAQVYSPHSKRPLRQKDRRTHFVAIKKIYVTSSPMRIMNELDLLHDLRNCSSIAPLITAFRHQDQVVAILPYFSHQDFRSFFQDMSIADMRVYFRSLFTAMKAVHAHGIIHRDIKPTNFLYNTKGKQGVLVDFGLAEREGTDWHPCLCTIDLQKQRQRLRNSYTALNGQMQGYPKEDRRPAIRANRAGTRGFRAPEVLFKCTAQTTKLDIWSAGVMLLTIMSKRFPFFHSTDDVDAVIELASIFGRRWMQRAAIKHGQLFDTNLHTVTELGYRLEKIVMWSTGRRTKDAEGNRIPLSDGEMEAFDFLAACLEYDPEVRIAAADALNHPFLQVRQEEGSEDEMDVLSMSQ